MLQLELPDDVLVRELLLLELQLEAALVLAHLVLVLVEVVLLQLEGHVAVGLEGRDVVLVLVQKMLDLLLVDLRVFGSAAAPVRQQQPEGPDCQTGTRKGHARVRRVRQGMGDPFDLLYVSETRRQ